MGVVDKLKRILFDEEDVEVPVSSDELPERELRIVADKLEKKVASKTVKKETVPSRSFKDYHIDEDEEDTIVELKIPKDESEEEEPKPQEKRIKFPIDDFDDIEEEEEEYVPKRSHYDEEPRRSSSYSESPRVPKYINDLANEKKQEPREEKDYRKIIHDLDEDDNKKPFEVTPIISPVFGVLNKNYKQEEIAEKKAMITQVNSGAKSRTFGPVSYNDAPLPRPHVYDTKNNGMKDDLVELNTTISDLISNNHEVDESDIEMPAKIVPDEIEMPKAEAPRMIEDEVDDDFIIATDNYDELPSSIEKPSTGHTNIEDAFESTSEFDSINENDRAVLKHSLEEEIEDEDEDDDEGNASSYDEEEFVAKKVLREDEEEIDPVEDDEDEEPERKIEIEEIEPPKKEKKKSTIHKEMNLEDVIEQGEKEEDEDDRLTDTIETDLFNLIDSMYKDDEDEEDSEEE